MSLPVFDSSEERLEPPGLDDVEASIISSNEPFTCLSSFVDPSAKRVTIDLDSESCSVKFVAESDSHSVSVHARL